MRFASLIAASAFFFATAASAQSSLLAPIAFSPEFQTELEDEYGVREGEVLREAVARAVNDAIARRAVAPGVSITVEVTIVDADPNRPTFAQLQERPQLDAIRSISLGGAELRAVLRGPDGAVLGEVSHRRYDHDLFDIGSAATTWTTARRSISQFANKVADAYVAAAS
jgi:hypothetical protein